MTTAIPSIEIGGAIEAPDPLGNGFPNIDITELRALEALRRSQQDLEDFFENGVVGLQWVASDGTILRANQAELDLLGYTREEYVGRPLANFHADRVILDDILARLSGGEKLDKYPARLRAKDGSIKHVQISSNVRFETGAFVHTRCFTVDVTAQQQAEALLRERERQSRALLDALPAAVYTTDAEGRITYYNEAAVELSGRRPELGSDQWCVTWRLYRPDGTPLPHDECPMAVALKENRAVRGAEAVAERPDGSRVPFIPFPTPLRDESGAMVGAVNMLVDITERKAAENALRASDERYRALFASTPMAVFVCDRNAVIQDYNNQAVELWGREPVRGAEQHCGSVKLWLPNGTPLPHAQSPIVEVLRTGIAVCNVEVFIERPDGSRLPVLVNFAPLKNTEGEVTGAITSFADITERKRAEVAVRDSEQQFQVLADNIPALCWMARADGWIDWYNHNWYEYTGTTPESQEGWGWESVHDPQELPAVMERWKASIASGQPFEMVFPLKGADGAFRPFLTRIVPHRDAEGRLIRWFGTNIDISAEREAAARQQLLVDELNHRVKNILATVQSIAAQLLKGTSNVEHRKTFDGRLVALSRTHDLLTRDSWESASLRDLLLQEFEPYRSEERTRFVVHGPDLRLKPKAALTLGMAFHELATNAAKYGALSKPAGQVRVTWEVLRASEPGALRFKWMETGGPPVKKREHKGFGSTLIERGLSLELEGEARVEFDPSGLICTMEIPLAAAGAEK